MTWPIIQHNVDVYDWLGNIYTSVDLYILRFIAGLLTD